MKRLFKDDTKTLSDVVGNLFKSDALDRQQNAWTAKKYTFESDFWAKERQRHVNLQ